MKNLSLLLLSFIFIFTAAFVLQKPTKKKEVHISALKTIDKKPFVSSIVVTITVISQTDHFVQWTATQGAGDTVRGIYVTCWFKKNHPPGSTFSVYQILSRDKSGPPIPLSGSVHFNPWLLDPHASEVFYGGAVCVWRGNDGECYTVAQSVNIKKN